MWEAFQRRQVVVCWDEGYIENKLRKLGWWKRTRRPRKAQALAKRPNAMHTKQQMQGFKLLKIEGTSTLGIFELRNGQYWDGIRVTRMDNGVTPMPDGFYVCELTPDGYIVQNPSGGDAVQGPYASAKEAERKPRKEMAKLAEIGEELVREGRVRREVGPDGVVRYQAIVTEH
jgi:hypothetical protein